MFEKIADNEAGKPYLGTNHYLNTNIHLADYQSYMKNYLKLGVTRFVVGEINSLVF